MTYTKCAMWSSNIESAGYGIKWSRTFDDISESFVFSVCSVNIAMDFYYESQPVSEEIKNKKVW